MLKRLGIFLAYVATIVSVIFLAEFIMSNMANSLWRTENAKILTLIDEKWQYMDTPIMLRNGESLAEKSAEKKRILVVGDSFVYGDGYVNSNQIWWGALQESLLTSGYNIEVVAAGYNGMSAFEEYKLLSETDIIEEVDPDLILMTWVANDLESKSERACEGWKPAAYVICSEKNELAYKTIANTYNDTKLGDLRDLFPNIAHSIETAVVNKYEYDENFNETVGYGESSFFESITSDESFEWNEQNFFAPFGEFIGSLDVPVSYVIMSSTPNDNYSKLDRVMSLFEKYNINYYQYLDELAELDFSSGSSSLYINPVNSHPSHNITSFYAKSVLASLEKDYGAILGQKEPYSSSLNINDATPWNISLEKKSETEYEAVYELVFPELDSSELLYMPIKKRHLKLNFEAPVPISHIYISGDNLSSAEIWLNRINEKGYDDQKYIGLGKKKVDFSWEADESQVTSINIYADFSGGFDRTIRIQLAK